MITDELYEELPTLYIGIKYSTSHNATIYFTYTSICTVSVLNMYHCTSSVNVLYFVSECSGMECVLHGVVYMCVF